MNPKAIIFDMDGVLIDSEPLLDSYYAKILKTLGVNAIPSVFEALRGSNTKTFWEYFVTNYKITFPNQQFLDNVRKGYLDFLKTASIEPTLGTKELLEYCQAQQIAVAVASSASSKRLTGTLKLLDILDYFPIIVSGQDIIKGKPAPDIFLEAAKRLQIPTDACIVIEDSTSGVQAAKAGRFFCIEFTGNKQSKTVSNKADVVFDTFDAIIRFIKN
jgi:beta-phosphoglucomutase